jgi:CubicO group peptidase (beta-lactamase class C family)
MSLHKEKTMNLSSIVNLPVHGICKEKFSAIYDAFLVNFVENGEIGARVTVIQGEETVVDLWGGYTDETRMHEWHEDTLVNTMSISKGIVAMAAHLLADRRLLEYEAPVAQYWPEFGQAGKEKITVRQLLSHQASLVYAEDALPGDVLNFDAFATKLAAQSPNWEPWKTPSYHSVSYGFLVGTLIKRISGRPVDQFIKEELVGPVQADYILGCTDEEVKRVVPTIFNPKNELMTGGLINDKTMNCFAPLPEDPLFLASSLHWKSVNPSSSGVTNANGIARLFAPLANQGTFNGNKFFSTETIAAMSEEQWHAQDSLFGNEFRVTMGLLLNIDFNYFGREGNVGSAGAGGFVGFSDPENHLSFAYTPVRMTTGAGMGNEPRILVDSLYASL